MASTKSLLQSEKKVLLGQVSGIKQALKMNWDRVKLLKMVENMEKDLYSNTY